MQYLGLVDTPTVSAPSDWAQSEIDKAVGYGLIDSNTNYSYQNNITREQFAELIVTCVEKLVDTSYLDYAQPFIDSSNPQVLKAASMGIVSGVGDNYFAPEQNITRQEIAVMMYRAIKYVENWAGTAYIQDDTWLDGYIDSDMISDWAYEAMAALINNQILFGTGDAAIAPLDNTTVEQAILLDVRIFERML